MNIPWVEKYRPRHLKDIVQQEEIIKVLRNTMETGNLPHLMFYGPSGTGKTSTILAIAHELFGLKRMNERVIELNASDERGIKVVRKNIITFARIAIGTPDPDYPSPPFKLIILDEADAMTPDAQSALRKIMETMSHITRFCFICNYINQIIDPISSRCMKFRFKPLSISNILFHITKIAKCEKMNIQKEALEQITLSSDGDLRKAIMTLQNLKYMENCFSVITKSDIIRITGGLDEDTFNIHQFKNIDDILNFVTKIHNNGCSSLNILLLLKKKIIEDDILTEINKKEILLKMCQIEKQIVEGGNEFLQLLDIFCFCYFKQK